MKLYSKTTNEVVGEVYKIRYSKVPVLWYGKDATINGIGVCIEWKRTIRNAYFEYENQWYLLRKWNYEHRDLNCDFSKSRKPAVFKRRRRTVVPFQYCEGIGTMPHTDRNNCTVVANSIAFDMSMEDSYNLLKKHGRKDNKGFAYSFFVKNRHINGKIANPVREINSKRVDEYTVNNIMPYLDKEGVYIVAVRGHVFAVKNGVVLDRFVRPRQKVELLYKVE